MPDGDAASKTSHSATDEALLALILEAFAVARNSGKEKWNVMHAGVLKNRVLLLCGGKLTEPEWGSMPFTRLLQRFPEVLSVDFGRTPPMVELLCAGRIESAAASPEIGVPERGDVSVTPMQADEVRRWRLRSDLWDAVMGIRTKEVFIWRDDAAVRVPPEEAAQDPEAPRLPTLSGPELDAWQKQFADDLAEDKAYGGVLKSWGEGASPTSALPRHLQHLWYGRLKTLVRERIESWFEQNGVEPPRNLVQVPDDRIHTGGNASVSIRVLVERCIRSMTDEELGELRFPAAVLLRVHP